MAEEKQGTVRDENKAGSSGPKILLTWKRDFLLESLVMKRGKFSGHLFDKKHYKVTATSVAASVVTY